MLPLNNPRWVAGKKIREKHPKLGVFFWQFSAAQTVAPNSANLTRFEISGPGELTLFTVVFRLEIKARKAGKKDGFRRNPRLSNDAISAPRNPDVDRKLTVHTLKFLL